MGVWIDGARVRTMQDAGSFTGGPPKGVLHTTETNVWPSYRDGTIAPHLTVLADTAAKSLTVQQHVSLDRAAKSLRNEPGGVETNRDSAIQIELVGTCNPGAVGMYFWPKADEWALSQLAQLMREIESLTGVPRRAVQTWNPYPQSAGLHASQRLSLTQWDSYSGWLGHQHVPENTHGDPGAIDAARLVRTVVTNKPEPRPVPHTLAYPFPLKSGEAFGDSSHSGRTSSRDRYWLRVWQARMRARGWTIGVDGLYGPQTRSVAVAFQQEKGLAVDGLIGVRTWNAAWSSPITP